MYDQILGKLRAANVPHTIHEHAPSVTVEDAAQNLWFPVEQLVKTIAFRVKGGGWVLVGLCGYNQVDYKKLAAAVGVNRTKLMRLMPDEVTRDLGYVLGGVSPFAPNAATRVLLDDSVLAWDAIYCGTGRVDRTLEIAPEHLVKVTNTRVASLARENQTEAT